MKHQRLRHRLAVSAVALALTTCADLTRIRVTTEAMTVIPRGTPIEVLLGQLGFEELATFDITQTEKFRNGGYERSQIDSVKLRRLVLSIDDPSGATFDFLDAVSFFAEAEGLARVEIARLDPVPRDVAEIELDVLDVELVDFATAEVMTIVTEARGRRPPEDTTVSAFVGLDVDIAVTAACSR